MELTANNVQEVIRHCLYKDEEIAGLADGDTPNGMVKAEVVMTTLGLHPDRLEEKREDIQGMVDCLPDEFATDIGGGMSFLNACVTKDGNQWGEHTDIDALLALGIATDTMGFCLSDRKLWEVMPGGMPYIWAKRSNAHRTDDTKGE